MRPLRRLGMILAVIMFVPAVVMTGCGGSDGTPAGSAPCAEFTPSVGSTPAVTTSVDNGSSTCDILVLNVNVAGVDNLTTAGFTVRFPADLLSFLGVDDTGSIMRQGGIDVETLSSAATPVAGTNLFEVTVGITRLTATAPGVDIGATPEPLLQLLFSRGTGNGAGSISYVDDELLDDQGAPNGPQPISGVTWHGGTITVN